MHDITFTEQALQDVRALSKFVKQQVKKAIDKLAESPYAEGLELQRDLRGLWSLHVGDYRVIYQISDFITILTVGHRSNVYLSNLLKDEIKKMENR